MSEAPLLSSLTALAARPGVLRFHMPGHKGRPCGSLFDSVFPIDYTELPLTGNLYDSDGPIARAEEEVARWYGMDGCFFLTCGATQGIKAALQFYCPSGGSVVLDRNCHKSVIDGCALLDLHPCYVCPDFSPATGVTGDISPDELTCQLRRSGASAAVVTSPTYYGHCLNIAALADAAHACGAALIVDSAHGAHLRACGCADPALEGADAIIFSAHKTLCALGQGAYLLFRGLDNMQCRALRAATALFGTTSPSYAVMASLDWALACMERGNGLWQSTAERALELRRRIELQTPFSCLHGGDPCRLTVRTDIAGLSGFDAAKYLFAMGIEPEMQDSGRVVFILTPQDTRDDWSRLENAIHSLACHTASDVLQPPLCLPPLPPAPLSPRQALTAPKERRPLCECVGAVAGENLAPYPPGVAVVVQGETLTKFCIEYLCKMGYNEDTYIQVISSAAVPPTLKGGLEL